MSKASERQGGKQAPWTKRLWRWMEFGEKTGWQWLELLSVLALPVMLALAGFYFTGRLDQQQQEIEARRAKSEQQLEEQRSQGAALQAYLDEMGNLMINRHLQDANQDGVVFILARARTTTVVIRSPHPPGTSMTAPTSPLKKRHKRSSTTNRVSHAA